MQQSTSSAVASMESNLRRIVSQGRVSHAYLLETPDLRSGLSLAQTFAQLLLCENGNGCGTCKNCKMVLSHSHPDLCLVSLPEDKKQITVAQIRDVIQDSYVKPYMGSRKVILITDGAAMTAQAQNALLKLLEEPPGNVIFLILCTNHMNLLETVRSRTSLLQLQQIQLSSNDIALEEETRDALFSQAQKLAEGRALDLFSSAEYFGVRDRKNRKDKKMLSLSFDYLLAVFRELMLIKLGCGDLVQDNAALISAVAQQTPLEQIVRVIEQLYLAKRRLERNVQYDLLIMSMLYGCMTA